MASCPGFFTEQVFTVHHTVTSVSVPPSPFAHRNDSQSAGHSLFTQPPVPGLWGCHRVLQQQPALLSDNPKLYLHTISFHNTHFEVFSSAWSETVHWPAHLKGTKQTEGPCQRVAIWRGSRSLRTAELPGPPGSLQIQTQPPKSSGVRGASRDPTANSLLQGRNAGNCSY